MNPESSYLPPEIAAAFDWQQLLAGGLHAEFIGTILPPFVASRRWFGAKARARRGLAVVETFDFSALGSSARLAFVRVEFADGPPETYALPLQIATGETARRIAAESPRAALAWFRSAGEATLLFDAIYDAEFRAALLRTIAGARELAGSAATLQGIASRAFTEPAGDFPSRVLEVEQSNSSLVYGDRFFLKLYRRLEAGVNPDAEITRFLSERQHFAHVPPFAGALECRRTAGPSSVLALLVGLVPNEGDAWTGTLALLRDFCVRLPATPPEHGGIADGIGAAACARAALLGQRTGGMHVALAADASDLAFAPEPFTAADWRALHDSMCATARQGLAALRRELSALPEPARADAAALCALEEEIVARHARLLNHPIATMKTRIHGDYHLGQVLLADGDLVILDFEGEPARPLAERKLKASPLRDVAGMLRSFGYAAHTALRAAPPEDAAHLAPWLRAWEQHVSRLFLDAYRAATAGAPFIPADSADFAVLLETFLLDKAIYEVAYELNNRPAWLPIPIAALLALLRPETGMESRSGH